MSDLECTVCASGVTSPHGVPATPGQAAVAEAAADLCADWAKREGLIGTVSEEEFTKLAKAFMAGLSIGARSGMAAVAAQEPHAAPELAGERPETRALRELHAIADRAGWRTDAQPAPELAAAMAALAGDGKTGGQLVYEAFQRIFPTEDWGPWESIDTVTSDHARAGWESIAAAVETGQVRLARQRRDDLERRFLALAADYEAEASAIAPAGSAPDDAPDMADQIRAEVLGETASKIRKELDI